VGGHSIKYPSCTKPLPLYAIFMQSVTLTIFFLLTVSTALFSQNPLSPKVKGAVVRSSKPSDSAKSISGCGSLREVTEKKEMALFIINDLMIAPEFNERSRFINPENIAEVYVYQRNDSIAKSYGEIARNGVIKIILKPGVKLTPLTEVLKDSLLDKYTPNMKICIDGEFIEFPEKILVDKSSSFYAFAIISSKKEIEGIIKLNELFVNIVTRL